MQQTIGRGCINRHYIEVRTQWYDMPSKLIKHHLGFGNPYKSKSWCIFARCENTRSTCGCICYFCMHIQLRPLLSSSFDEMRRAASRVSFEWHICVPQLGLHQCSGIQRRCKVKDRMSSRSENKYSRASGSVIEHSCTNLGRPDSAFGDYFFLRW